MSTNFQKGTPVFLKEIERQQKDLEDRVNAVPDAVRFARESKVIEGKTVGIKLPAQMRKRLDEIQKQHELASVKQAMLLVLHLGLRQLEGTRKR